MTKQEGAINNFTTPWEGDDYITSPCDNESCCHKDASKSGCRKHSRHMVSICEDYVPEEIEEVK